MVVWRMLKQSDMIRVHLAICASVLRICRIEGCQDMFFHNNAKFPVLSRGCSKLFFPLFALGSFWPNRRFCSACRFWAGDSERTKSSSRGRQKTLLVCYPSARVLFCTGNTSLLIVLFEMCRLYEWSRKPGQTASRGEKKFLVVSYF